MFSYHDFSDVTRVEEILRTFSKNLPVALVTDSGTPLISDPGFAIVKKGSQRECLLSYSWAICIDSVFICQ